MQIKTFKQRFGNFINLCILEFANLVQERVVFSKSNATLRHSRMTLLRVVL
jgi:hypothetical protein